ncbi:helix-turn-helix domain-containing protein [Aquimarina sp. AD10]|uniref:AraC family transcriptional regulator n=1 Tax=Aquimarina sp. AD10 TaxID=1714849 RepID=UPI000E491D2C|nr:AraC family transcriptional regulator [Aquimarina sp. AD10]AXT61945.1 helix-turn-helix domain-containing protein [Aquimarina sp. AD10]RKN02405.1 helix-turn-helix domain-containing protein [Aquimarina sp. AD10]
MQKVLYTIFVLCINIISVFAQDSLDIDFSLYNKVVNSPQDSITKYKNLSREAYRVGDLNTFKTYSDIVLAIAIANDLEEIRVRSLVNIAIYYQQTDQYEKSLESYLEAEKLVTVLPNGSYLKILIETNLGNLHNSLGNSELAILAMKKALELSKDHDNTEEFENVAYSVLGTAYLNQKKFHDALTYMKLSKKLAIKMNRDDNLIRTMINISECYLKEKKYEDVIKNSSEVLELITNKESIESKALTQITIGAAYIGLEKYAKALTPLEEAKDIGVSGGFLKIKMDAHNYLAQVYESLGKLKKSLGEQKAYTQTRDQYFKTLSKAQRLKVEKESEIKSDIISQQQESIVFLSKEKQLSIFAGVVLVILFIVSSIIYWNRRRKLKEESIQLQGDKLLLKSENEVLKDKLNTIALTNHKQKISEQNSQSKEFKKTSFSLQEQEKHMKNVLEYMEEKKPYLDHEIKQSDIAKNLDMSVHLFSEVLNACFKKNFNSFINLYRVDQAKQLMKNPRYKHYKILAIGYEAGFPSKTSFNRVFKNLVGLTPTEYQKKHSNSL